MSAFDKLINFKFNQSPEYLQTLLNHFDAILKSQEILSEKNIDALFLYFFKGDWYGFPHKLYKKEIDIFIGHIQKKHIFTRQQEIFLFSIGYNNVKTLNFLKPEVVQLITQDEFLKMCGDSNNKLSSMRHIKLVVKEPEHTNIITSILKQRPDLKINVDNIVHDFKELVSNDKDKTIRRFDNLKTIIQLLVELKKINTKDAYFSEINEHNYFVKTIAMFFIGYRHDCSSVPHLEKNKDTIQIFELIGLTTLDINYMKAFVHNFYYCENFHFIKWYLFLDMLVSANFLAFSANIDTIELLKFKSYSHCSQRGIFEFDEDIEKINNKEFSSFANKTKKSRIWKQNLENNFEIYRKLLISNVIKKYNYVPDQNIFNYCFEYCDDAMFDSICELQISSNIKFTSNHMTHACSNKNMTMLKFLLDQKLSPSENDIQKLSINIDSTTSDMIKLISAYSNVVPKEIKKMLEYVGASDPDKVINTKTILTKLNAMTASEEEMKLAKKKYFHGANFKKLQKDGSIENLRVMFLFDTIDNIKQFMQLHKIEPDLICCSNSVINEDSKVILYVFDNYSYKPSILHILKSNDWNKRIYLLSMFYPEMTDLTSHDEQKIAPKNLLQNENIKSSNDMTNVVTNVIDPDDDTDEVLVKKKKSVVKKSTSVAKKSSNIKVKNAE